MSKFRPHNRHGANLTPEGVIALYQMRDSGKTVREVAEYAGSSPAYIGRLLRGDVWKDVYAAYYGAEPKAVEAVADSQLRQDEFTKAWESIIVPATEQKP